MKTVTKILLLLTLLLSLSVSSPAIAQDEENAILSVIENAYVKGINAKFNKEAVMSGFHPAFVMFVRKESELVHYSLADWVGGMKEPADPNAAPRNIRFKPLAVNVAGDAASACIELYRDDKISTTDFFLLYKIDGNWKIVGKAYYYHKNK